jgi:hypothetical protein
MLDKNIMTRIRELSELNENVFASNINNEIFLYIKKNLLEINDFFEIIGLKMINFRSPTSRIYDDIFKLVLNVGDSNTTFAYIKTNYLNDLRGIYTLMNYNIISNIQLDPVKIKLDFVAKPDYATKVKKIFDSQAELNEAYVDKLLKDLVFKQYLVLDGAKYRTTDKVLLYVIFEEYIKTLYPEEFNYQEQKMIREEV